MALYKRSDSPYYWASFVDTVGARRYESTKCTDKTAAKQWLKRAERASVGSPDAPICSLSTAIDLFGMNGLHGKAAATKLFYAQKCNQLGKYLGEVDINSLSKTIVREYMDRRRRDGVTESTIQKELIACRQVLLYAIEQGKFVRSLSDVLPKFSVPYTPRKRWLTIPEFQFVRLFFESSRQLWLDVAVNSGGRRSEIEKLRWVDVDLENRRIHFRGTKTRSSDRVIPITTQLHAVLTAARAVATDEYVVRHWKNVHRELKEACETGGFPPVTPNDLRRTYASWLKQRGVDSFVVASLLGHTTSKMVELTYGKLDHATLASAVRVLDRHEG